MWFLLSAVFPPSLRLEENANLKVELGKLAVFREEIMEGASRSIQFDVLTLACGQPKKSGAEGQLNAAFNESVSSQRHSLTPFTSLHFTKLWQV